MELINQHTKVIMEGCKARAREAGLSFQDESLEYIVTNRDLIELGPKNMIPTLYDYWVHDVEVLKEKGRYELYPHNPYETVINTRPAISFYNDNNPDWLNVMIFYHVLAHIDFFQNNQLFKHTWSEDFTGRALSDKRLIAMLRSEKGRWVDYVIEFTRGIDNLVAFYPELSKLNKPQEIRATEKLDFYFDTFLQDEKKVKLHDYLKEIDRYNELLADYGEMTEAIFFSEAMKKYPEFEALYEKNKQRKLKPTRDIIQYILEHSAFLKSEENKWMKSIIEIIRHTSLFFQPQIRTKIMNEGWASYWHELLFLSDDRIQGNEVGFARVNAKVTALPRVGLNPYALGMRLFSYIEEMSDKGKLSYEYERLLNSRERQDFDRKTGKGRKTLFEVRENYSDLMFIQDFVDQEFMARYKLFVSGRRLNDQKGVWEYYVESRRSDKYKEMLTSSLYHPPYIEIDESKGKEGSLYLTHRFEGKPLVKEFISNTMLGIEYLWGGPVKLETTELVDKTPKMEKAPYIFSLYASGEKEPPPKEPEYQRVLYSMENRKLSRIEL